MKKFLRKLVLRATLCGAGLACALAAHAEGAALLLRLHAWDGKSDPSKDPAFVLQEDGTYLLENQKCYPNMEFGIRNCDPASNSQIGWYGGYSQHIVPNVVYQTERTDNSQQRFPNNWVITQKGNYDFRITVGDNDYGQKVPVTLTVTRHNPGNEWKLLAAPMSQQSSGIRFRKIEDATAFYFTSPEGTKMVPDGTAPVNTAFNLTDGENSSATVTAGDIALVNAAGDQGFIYHLDHNVKFSVMGREGNSGDFTATTLHNYNGYQFETATSQSYNSDINGTAMMVKVPDNFEFYINDNNGIGITSAAGTVVSLTNNQPVEVALSSFGGAESATSHFKIEKGGNYMIFFDASAMLVKIYRPNTAPWYYSGTYPEALWLHGNLKLETGEINDWGVYHDRLKLQKEKDPEEYDNSLNYYADLDLTGDSYFRILSADSGITGIWKIFGVNDLQYFDNLRGCWSPASTYNVDVPEMEEAAAPSWSKSNPDEGTMYHLPAGKWRVYVKYEFSIYGNYDPNCLKVYAERLAEEGEETPPVYVFMTGTSYQGSYSTFKQTSDGSYQIKTQNLSFQIFKLGPKPEDSYSNRENIYILPADKKNENGYESYDTDIIPGTPKKLKQAENSWDTADFTIKGERGTYIVTFNPTAMELTVERDFTSVNMPLLPSDFTDADGKPKTHYFVVGSRTADFRLLPEWELTKENGYKIENRLMYPGMLGIAAVDNYEDYTHHKFRFYHISDKNDPYSVQTGTELDENWNPIPVMSTIYSGKVLNSAGSYTLADTDGFDKEITATAIKDYGNYYSTHYNSGNPWPFVVLGNMYGEDNSSGRHNIISSWWHFCDFAPEADGKYSRQTLSEAFKKGTPSLASSIGITLDENGRPATLEIGEVKTWAANKADVLAEVNFMLCGDDIVNEIDRTSRHSLDPQKTSLFGYTNVNEWANQWIQYDPQTGDPYVDGDGKYLFQTVYQTSWMKDHPVIFHRAADNTDYNSNSLVFSPVTAGLTADADNFVDYYNGMKNLKLGDGTRKQSAEGTSIAWDFTDQMGKPDPDRTDGEMTYGPNTDINAPAGGWKPYVLSDISFGGMFKVWSGFGGGHAGYGAWVDQVEVGDGYAWFNLNVGHQLARNPQRVRAQLLASSIAESKAAEAEADPNIDKPGSKVNFYLTGKDEPAADFMTYYDDVNESYPLRSYRRLILWLDTKDRDNLSDNATSGMAKSFVQMVVTDLSPVIKGRLGDAERQIVSAWHLQEDYMMEEKTVTKAVVTMFRDGEEIASYEETDAEGMKATDCTAEGKFPHTWNDLVAGEYWYRIDVTYDDGNVRSSLSNHLYLFDKIEPALLTAWQRTATDATDAEGRTLYGFNVSGKVSLPEGADNRPFKEYKDNEGHSRTMLLKDLISGYTLTVKELGRDAETVNVEYTPGTESEFLLKLHGTTRVAISAQAAAKPSPVTVNGVVVDLTEKELNLLKYTLASTSVEMVLPTPGAEVSDFTVATVEYDSETDQAGHPGHASYAPVRYRNANSLNARVAVNDNVLLEDGETAVYAVTAAEGSVGEVTDGVAEATRLPVALGEDNKPVSDNTITVAATYSRDNAPLTSVTAETQAQHTFDMVAPATLEVLPEDMAITGINNRDSSNPGTICDLLIYVPSSINDGASLPEGYVILGGFEANAADYTTDAEGHDAWGEVPGQRQDTPKVKAPMAWNFQGYNNAYETAKYPDGFPGLLGSSSLNCGFSEYNGTGWGIENDWAHAIAREGFAMSFRHALFVPKTVSGDLLNKAFTVKTYNVYPFLVDTPDTPAAEAAAKTADARAAATRVVPLSLEGEIKVPAKNWVSAVVSGIADTYADSDEKVDVYTPSGIRLMEGVTRAEALTRLEPGIYLIGSDKVVVK